MTEPQALISLVQRVKACQHCELPQGPRPVLQIASSAKVLIVGQAPGRRVHETGVPFNDPSGDRLREWMGIERDVFYDASRIALLPMAFCYPGTGERGDLPPPKACAERWREQLLAHLKKVELTLILGQYSIQWHLPNRPSKESLTSTVRRWQDFWPAQLVLPHPSPRNNLWLKKNLWFNQEIVPRLQTRIADILDS